MELKISIDKNNELYVFDEKSNTHVHCLKWLKMAEEEEDFNRGYEMISSFQSCSGKYSLNYVKEILESTLTVAANKHRYMKENCNSIKTYIMFDENIGYLKIGKSKNPKFRERTLQSQNPSIKIFKICDKNVEKEIHKKYADKRVRGEWFDLSEEDIENIVNEYGFHDVDTAGTETGIILAEGRIFC